MSPVYKFSNAGGMTSKQRYTSMLAGNTTWNPWQPEGAYDSLATVTVGATAVASINFTGIPSGYTHLQIRGISKNTTGAGTYFVTSFNSDTSSANYTWHYLLGNGSVASAGAATSGTFPGSVLTNTYGGGANTFSAVVMDILDYTNNNKYKTIKTLSGFDDNGTGNINLTSNLWLSTSTISSITIGWNGGNFAQYSSLALFGVK